METEKYVSVIIPTYNRELFLKKAVDSVLRQTYRHFELLVVDDGSTDRTPELLDSYGGDIIHIKQENKGQAAARNAGIRAASYDLLAFLDSDDWIHERKLEIQVRAMNNDPQCGISHTEETWYRHGKLLNQKKKHRKEAGYIFERCLEMCVVGMSTVMIRRSVFAEMGYFDEEFSCCEDYDFWLRVSVNNRFMLIDQALTCKDGGRPDQVSYQYRVGMDRFRIKALCKCIKSGVLDREQRELALAELARKCRVYGQGCIRHGRSAEGRKYIGLPEKVAAEMDGPG